MLAALWDLLGFRRIGAAGLFGRFTRCGIFLGALGALGAAGWFGQFRRFRRCGVVEAL